MANPALINKSFYFRTQYTRSFTPPLNPSGDGIFNFKTITIAPGVTVRLAGDVYAPPVIWLASGAVNINGTIDASGQSSVSASVTTQRTTTVPGSGGFFGGYPAVGANASGAGSGPAGGGVTCSDNPSWAYSGGFLGNQFAVPLFGGSGGGGGGSHSGGAGGGAILIASDVSIAGAGSILANGGARTGYAGAGAGGAIRLVAPTVTLSGLLNASAGGNYYCPVHLGTAAGVVRIEAFVIGAINASGNLYTATPYGLFLSRAGTPTVRVVSVGGNPVATFPTGTFTVPDVAVNSNNPLPVVIEAANVPVGTVVTLVIFSENGPDLIKEATLAGTLASSTATVSVALPSGFSKGFVKATFTQ